MYVKHVSCRFTLVAAHPMSHSKKSQMYQLPFFTFFAFRNLDVFWEGSNTKKDRETLRFLASEANREKKVDSKIVGDNVVGEKVEKKRVIFLKVVLNLCDNLSLIHRVMNFNGVFYCHRSISSKSLSGLSLWVNTDFAFFSIALLHQKYLRSDDLAEHKQKSFAATPWASLLPSTPNISNACWQNSRTPKTLRSGERDGTAPAVNPNVPNCPHN